MQEFLRGAVIDPNIRLSRDRVPIAMVFEFAGMESEFVRTATTDLGLKYLVSPKKSMDRVIRDIDSFENDHVFVVHNLVGTLQSCKWFDESLGFKTAIVIVITISKDYIREVFGQEGVLAADISKFERLLDRFDQEMDSVRRYYGDNCFKKIPFNPDDNFMLSKMNTVLTKWLCQEGVNFNPYVFTDRKPIALVLEFWPVAEILKKASEEAGLTYLISSTVSMDNIALEMINKKANLYLVSNRIATVETCKMFKSAGVDKPKVVIVLTLSKSDLRDRLTIAGYSEVDIVKCEGFLETFEKDIIDIKDFYNKKSSQIEYHEVSLHQDNRALLDDLSKILKPWAVREAHAAEELRQHYINIGITSVGFDTREDRMVAKAQEEDTDDDYTENYNCDEEDDEDCDD